MPKITGVGGFFFKTDGEATGAWFKEKLGVPVEAVMPQEKALATMADTQLILLRTLGFQELHNDRKISGSRE